MPQVLEVKRQEIHPSCRIYLWKTMHLVITYDDFYKISFKIHMLGLGVE